MAELYDDWVVRPLTRAEFKLLSDEEIEERKLAQHRIHSRKYREENREKEKEYGRKYREENREKEKERHRTYKEENPEKEKERSRKYYQENTEKVNERNRLWLQTPAGQKSNTLSSWKNTYGLQEPPEEMERIYILRETQQFCSSCDVKLTRTGKCISTDASMDHCHITNRFRQICCRSCNNGDRWRIYWIDGIYGGTKVPRGPPQ
tara:strand:+ start:237 stop:854 length:618 start_codon:yes stop_codon:yes gene_type:complete